jgi:NAD(P)-dependent dehydrogenase (short-subunit alcohol dehydrogenase family)
MRFAGKVVWITGASSGIGEALALACAGEGAGVILSARRADVLGRVASRCGTAALALPFDVTDLDALPSMVDRAFSWSGRVDKLINNAGNFCSRTSLFPLRWLIMPLNISLHFEHHLDYCVPWYRLSGYHRAARELVPAPLRPEVFNVRVWEQLMGRVGRLPDPVRPYRMAPPGVEGVEDDAFDAAG